MRASLISSLAFFTLLAGCGGGGGDSTVFDFEGLWLSSFIVSSDLCGIGPNETGTVAFSIAQTSDVVTASNVGIVWQGTALSDSFTAVLSDLSLFDCPDGSALKTTTSTLRFADTENEKANSVSLSFFGDCPTFTEQCELTFTGSSIRLPASTAGPQVGENTLF